MDAQKKAILITELRYNYSCSLNVRVAYGKIEGAFTLLARTEMRAMRMVLCAQRKWLITTVELKNASKIYANHTCSIP